MALQNNLLSLILDYVRAKLPDGWAATLHACMGFVRETATSRAKPTTYHEIRMSNGERTFKIQVYRGILESNVWIGTVPETRQIPLSDAAFDLEKFLDDAVALIESYNATCAVYGGTASPDRH